MSSWYCTQTVNFRVKVDGKVQQVTVDLQNPLKSIEELETKTGLKCPEERQKELLSKLNTHSSEVPQWVQSVNVPDWYTHASSTDINTALNLGCELVQEQKRLSEQKLQTQVELKWKHVLEEKEQETERLLAQKEREVQTWRTTAVENLSSVTLESKLAAAKQEWEENQKRLLRTMERDRDMLVQQVKELQTRANQLEESRESLREKLEQRDVLMNKSVHKGDVGEDMVDMWLRTAFHGAVITDTSKEENKMDRHMEWEGVKIIVDSKHHSGKLHSKQDVKKFYDNIGHNPDAQIAILLCTTTTVPNHNRFWVETEIINDTQLAVFMNNVSLNPIERLQLLAGTVIQPWKEYVRLRQTLSTMVAGDELKAWNESAHKVLRSGWATVTKLQDHWAKTYSAIQEFQKVLSQCAEEIRTELHSLGIEAKKSKKSKQ